MKRFGFRCAAVSVVLFGAWARAGVVEAPLDVRKIAEAQFARPPTISRNGDSVSIAFQSSAATDVEVAVLDARGKVVRHIAAGLLGPNAPAPLRKDALAQELVWDGRGDAGEGATGAPFKARVRLGSRAKLDKYLGHEPLTFTGIIEAITVGAGGELFVLIGEGQKFGRAEIMVLDRGGKYLRTIMPYPASTPAERTESVGHLTIDGRRTPIVFSTHAFSVYPLTCGIRGQSMAWHPRGYLVAASSTGTAREHAPPRHLLAFDPRGGAPAGVAFVGPRILEPKGFMGGGGERGAKGRDRLAVSPDGQYVYLVQHFDSKRFESKHWKHGVYRLKWDDKEAGDVWLGRAERGAGDDAFDDPQGIAVAKDGTLFVCDRGNARIKVYSPDGKMQGKFEAQGPEEIAVHPRSGGIFVLARLPDNQGGGKLQVFSPWKDGRSAKMAEFASEGIAHMALDAESSPVRLWLATRTREGGQSLVPVTFSDGKFQAGAPVTGANGLVNPSFLAADPERDRVIVKEHRTIRSNQPFKQISLATGEAKALDLAGADITMDAAGNMYVMDGYAMNSLSRYDPAGNPLPFPGVGSHKIADMVYRGLGPDMGLFGHRVAANGDIYVLLTKDKVVGKELSIFGSDGRLKKRGFIAGMGSGDIGLGLDSGGNVYVGMSIRPGARPFAKEFMGQVPTANWIWWNANKWENKEKPPWAYLYSNPYLFGMGSVFRFGSRGGAVYGDQSGKKKKDIASPDCELEDAPPEAVPGYKTGYLTQDVKLVGADWSYSGIGPVPIGPDGPGGDPGCICMPARLDSDPFGRTYAPSAFYFSVEMIDPSGNRIARIGHYDNADNAGPDIAFAGPVACDYAEADGRLYVSDIGNRRLAIVRFDWSVSWEETVR